MIEDKEYEYAGCLKCGSSDISIITVKVFNEDTYQYDYYYGIKCDECGFRTPIEFVTIDDAFEAWNEDIDWDFLN